MSEMTMALYEEVNDLLGDWQPADYSEQIMVPEDRLAIASDVHLPYHNREVLFGFLDRVQARRAEAVVWLGDLMDMPTHSSWGQDDYSTTFEGELDGVEKLIRLTARVVDKQYWSSGNHEVRFMRRNANQFGMDRLARMANLGDLIDSGRLVTSDNPSLDARHGWMLTHPAKYGTTPLVVPGKVADLQQKHVVSAHAHHWAMGKSPSGKYTVVESGGLFDPKKVRYVQYQVTTHRAWVSGYVFLEYGQPLLFER